MMEQPLLKENNSELVRQDDFNGLNFFTGGYSYKIDPW